MSPEETARLQALQRYEILDTEPELNFDDATLLASQICGTPIALMSLVDDKRQWFKSKVGFLASETPREIAFCAHTILQTDVFVVPDARTDERFAANPLVTGDPRVRFYAGAPLLTSDGHALGTLCVIDQVPRELSLEKRAALQALSRQVVAQLESRRAAIELRQTVLRLREVEQSSRESDEKFQQLADNITDVFWIASPDLNVMHYISAGYETIWGRSRESLIADPHQWIDAILPDERQPVIDAFTRLRADTASVSVEYRIARPDGTIRWINDRGFQVRDAQGSLIRLAGVAADITERREAQDALARQQTELRVLFDIVPAMICFKDTENRILRVNKRLADSFGTTVQELEGKLTSEVYPQGAPAFFAEDLEVIKSGKPKLGVIDRVQPREGKERWIETDRVPLCGLDDKVKGIVVMVQDITERKMAAEALDRQQTELRALFDLVPAMICFKDTKNNILRANKQYADYFGMTVGDLEGKTMAEVYPEGADAFYQEDLEVIRTRRPKIGTVASIPKPDGTKLWIQTDLVPLFGSDGKVKGVVVMVQDITERKMAEEALDSQQTELRVLFDLMPAMVCFKDTKNNILRANKRFANRFGMTVDDVEGKSTAEISPRESSDFYAQDLEVIESGQSKMGAITSLQSRDGQESWFQTDLVPLCGLDDKVKGIVVMVQDITERKRRDEHVGRLAAIVDNSDDAIISKTLDGIVTSWNPAAERMFGYTASEITGQPLRLIIPMDRMEEEAGILAGFARGEIIRHIETVRIRKDRHRIDVSATISPIRDFEGRVIGASKIVRDITDRKQVEIALKVSESRYRSLFENMTEGYAYCRVLYHPDGKVADFIYLEVNKAFDSLTGLKNVVGRKVTEIIPGIRETNPELFEIYGRVASTGNVEKYETFLKALGIWFSVSVYSPAKDHFIAVFDNTTERKEAEAKIAFNEQRYRSLVEATTSMVWDTPASGQFEVEQPGWTAFTGQTFEELRGWGWLNVIHPDDRSETQRLWSAAFTDRSLYEIEHRILGRDGAYHDMTGRAVPILAHDGKIRQWIGVHTDITGRKRSEEALRLLSSAVLQSKESILITDAQLDLPGPKIIFANPAFTTMTGFSAEEALGKTPRILQGALTDRAVLQRLRRNLENDEVFAGEAINYRKDGSTYNQEWQIAPIHDSKEKTTHFVAIQRDITERTRLQARYRQLVESNVQGVLFWNRNGGVTGANDAFLRLVRHTREDLEAGRINWMELTPPEFTHLDRRALEEIAATGVCGLYEKEYILKDGTRVPLLLASAAFADNPDEGVSFVVDLTERRSLEARLYQSQKMETVGKLAGGIAHEFNSILTAIIGQSELLLGELPPGSSESKSASEIGKAAIRAANLTRQLLAYGRKQLLEPQTLDLNSVVSDMESTLGHFLGEETDLLIVRGAGLKAVKADAGQLEQVIMNIVLNAREAMPNGGKVTLETANVSFSPEDAATYPELNAGDYVMLAITDTGTGMSAAVRARVFEPFFSTKGVGQGTGLGLSTSYGIVKQSGGHISAYSEPAQGTTFKIYLPQVEEQPKPVVLPLTSPNLPRGTETVLLAEDDPALRKMATTLLEKLGYKVFTASNGMEALSLKQQRNIGHIDLLFTDVVMPHMSGKELSDRIRALYPHTKILFTSAFTENAFIHQGVLTKGVMLLQKPFTPSELARKLREVLDQ
jgi:PAS domain S-box-containing protein